MKVPFSSEEQTPPLPTPLMARLYSHLTLVQQRTSLTRATSFSSLPVLWKETEGLILETLIG